MSVLSGIYSYVGYQSYISPCYVISKSLQDRWLYINIITASRYVSNNWCMKESLSEAKAKWQQPFRLITMSPYNNGDTSSYIIYTASATMTQAKQYYCQPLNKYHCTVIMLAITMLTDTPQVENRWMRTCSSQDKHCPMPRILINLPCINPCVNRNQFTYPGLRHYQSPG